MGERERRGGSCLSEAKGDGCYICRPDDPDAPEDGCEACEADWIAYYYAVYVDGASDSSSADSQPTDRAAESQTTDEES